MKRKARRNPLPPPMVVKTTAKGVDGLVNAYRSESVWRWLYAATESLSVAYKTMSDHGVLPDGSDIVERTIETARRAIATSDTDLLTRLAHEIVGKKWVRLDGPPWDKREDVSLFSHTLTLASNHSGHTQRRTVVDQEHRAKRKLLMGAADLMISYESAAGCQLACIACREIMILPIFGYAVKQPKRRFTAGEEIIASVIVHAMTVA